MGCFFYIVRYVIIFEILDMFVCIVLFLKFYILYIFNYFINIFNKRKILFKRYMIN